MFGILETESPSNIQEIAVERPPEGSERGWGVGVRGVLFFKCSRDFDHNSGFILLAPCGQFKAKLQHKKNKKMAPIC